MKPKKIPAIISFSPNRVWRTYAGGKTLDGMEGKTDPQDSHFAEDWIGSTTRAINNGREEIEEGYSNVTIDGGTYALKDLMEQFPLELLGEAHFAKYGPNTQFLLKFLDAAIRLHIQAHPTIAFSQKHLNSNSGKTEAYVILACRKEITDPYIYLGFQHPLVKEDFKQAVINQDNQRILSCFEKIYIKPGDVFFVPGGLPHAIGEGVFMIEIMEPTDFVVRLEFERGGYLLPEKARFMDRGIDFALEMIDFTPIPVQQIKEKYFASPEIVYDMNGNQEWILIGKQQTSCFSVRKLVVTNTYKRNHTGFHAGIVTAGEGIIKVGEVVIYVKQGDRFLVPFQSKEVAYETQFTLEIVLTYPPDSSNPAY